MRSPVPESPDIVSRFPPMATHNLLSSDAPRVTKAVKVLMPRSRPSITPAAIAKGFFNAPQAPHQ